jgi:hypothetical protein
MSSSSIASKDFSRTTLAALRKQGIAVIGSTFVPGADGTFANGERAYQLDDNGTSKLRTFLDVLSIAGTR